MKVTLESTDQIVEVNGVPGRIWEGTTAAGIQCHAIITRIAVHKNDDASEFERELKETRPPSPAVRDIYPARMVL